MKINEIFLSIQGEGDYTGTPAIFIRTSRCNFTCKWCDTKYDAKMEINQDYLEEYLKQHERVRPIVVWTGGEPTLEDNMFSYLRVVDKFRLESHVETNGTKHCNWFVLISNIVCSPKLDRLDDNYRAILKEIYHYEKRKVQFKFVIDANNVGKEMRRVEKLLKFLNYNGERDVIINPISPKTDDKELLREYILDAYRLIVEWAMTAHPMFDYRYMCQFHKLVWGNKQGV